MDQIKTGKDKSVRDLVLRWSQLTWASRKLVIQVTLISTALALGISLLMHNSYKSVAVLIPDTSEDKALGLTGIADLASAAGINLGTAEPEKLYPAVIASETVLREVIYTKYKSEKFDSTVNLIQYWGLDEGSPTLDFEAALKIMTKILDIDYDKLTDIVTLTLWMPEPQLSADVLNNVVAQLDDFYKTKRVTSATQQRQWIEKRLAQVKVELKAAEDSLRYFLLANRTLVSPDLQIQNGRIQREVDIHSTEYVSLAGQLETVKIQEIKATPVITVMDRARAAGKKDKPHRLLITLACFILSIFGSTTYVYVRHEYGEAIRDFAEQAGWKKKKGAGSATSAGA